jgi:protein-S-isoprenylcysteine O-methyltransferase Ste14
MMVRIGNFLFRYRNGLFPVAYALLFLKTPPVLPGWRAAALIGFALASSGQALRAATVGLEYIIRGGRKRQVYAEKLVHGGMFAHSRNPLYLGNFLILAGVGIASNSMVFLCAAIPFFAFAYWAIIAAEENYLRNKFGQEFDDYCARVNRLIPSFSGVTQTLSETTFNWRRLLTAEYGSMYIWMAAMVLVILKNIWLSGESDANRALMRSLWVILAIVTIAYGVARYLKKSGAVDADLSRERKGTPDDGLGIVDNSSRQ